VSPWSAVNVIVGWIWGQCYSWMNLGSMLWLGEWSGSDLGSMLWLGEWSAKIWGQCYDWVNDPAKIRGQCYGWVNDTARVCCDFVNIYEKRRTFRLRSFWPQSKLFSCVKINKYLRAKIVGNNSGDLYYINVHTVTFVSIIIQNIF
jgi:hypothetical protein